MSFALSACLIIYYLDTFSSLLPSFVPFAHFTFATLFVLLPRVTVLSPASFGFIILSVRNKGCVPVASPGYNDHAVRLEVGHQALSRKLESDGNKQGTLFRAMLKKAVELVDDNAHKMLLVTSMSGMKTRKLSQSDSKLLQKLITA